MPTPQEWMQYQQLLSQFMPRRNNIDLTTPQGLLGLGLLGGSFLGKPEPGYVTEARQNIRNLSSPTGFSSGFTNTVGGLQNQFQPLLDQQQKRALDQIQQRYTAAFPSTFGPQGPEFGAYGNYLRDQFLPQQQAFYGQLGLQGLNTQLGAASRILELDRPDPFKEALSGLGGALILGSGQGQGGGFDLGSLIGRNQQGTQIGGGNLFNGIRQASGIGNVGLSGLFSGGNSLLSGLGLTTGVNGGFSSLTPQAGQALVSSVSRSLGGVPLGGFEQLENGTVAILGQNGETLGTLMPNGQILNSSGSIVGSASPGFLGALNPFSTGFAPGFRTGFGTGLGNLTGSLGGVLSGLGIGTSAFGVGDLIGGQIPSSELGGTAAGAAGGAATGAALGTFVFPGIGTALGVLIGGLSGAGGGFLGSQKAAQAQKAVQLANDQRSQGQTTSSIGSFWTEALGAAGYGNLNGWDALVRQTQADVNGPAKSYSFDGISTTADQPDNLAYIGSRILLRQIQQQHPEITSLDQVQGFRDRYVDFILNNTFIGGEGGSGLAHPSSIGQKGSLLTQAGLSY